MPNKFDRAFAILKGHYSQVVDSLADQAVEQEAQFSDPFGKWEEVVELHARRISILNCCLAALEDYCTKRPMERDIAQFTCPTAEIAERMKAWLNAHERAQLTNVSFVPEGSYCTVVITFRRPTTSDGTGGAD